MSHFGWLTEVAEKLGELRRLDCTFQVLAKQADRAAYPAYRAGHRQWGRSS
jgi:hypothetical protein